MKLKKSVTSDAEKAARRRRYIEEILNALGIQLERCLSSKQLSVLARDHKLPFVLKEVSAKRAIKLEQVALRREQEESGERAVLIKPSQMKPSRFDRKP
jgi:hypothetical protein